MKFKRAQKRTKNTIDDIGAVRLHISLANPNGAGAKKGNIARGMTIESARVSDVLKAIKEALFEEKEQTLELSDD